MTSVPPFPKLSAIRFSINEANLLKLSSPPHVEQKNHLIQLVEKGENWQIRAKDAINKKSNISTLQDLLNESILFITNFFIYASLIFKNLCAR